MAIWEKLFSKITFKDYPDTSTPLNANNLNAMTSVIDGLDDRVLSIIGNMASQYDNSATYAVGDYTIYNGLLYKCIIAVDTPEEFDSTKWQQTDCGTEFDLINGEIDTLNSNLEFHAGDTYLYDNLYDTSLSSAAGKMFTVKVFLPKDIGADVTSVSVSADISWLRKSGGGISVENSFASYYTHFQNTVLIDISADSIGALEYVTVALSNIKITFN